MKCALQVASPPPKPLLVFDGDCGFCRFWVNRWHNATGEQVDYIPFQDERVTAGFPELSRAQLESAVHLVLPDGTVFSGAEAVLRALAHQPHERWLLDWYEHSPAFARAAEGLYGFIARHRGGFSTLTRLAWGARLEPPTYRLASWVFLRSLGIIYLIAFLSLWVQILGLVGESGILPAKATMAAVHHQADLAKLGWERYHVFPTLCWFGTGDAWLRAQCAAGTVLALLLMVGIAPAPCLVLLWLLYLSLATVCREFLGFQWDSLLLETGFLAILLAPLQLLPRPSRAPPPSRLCLWLLNWLLFRLMFQSGCVKWLSGDPTWRNLTALSFHYETQPLPTWIGWYAHQLPGWFQKTSTLLMFGIELLLPFLIFAPRRPRQWACIGFVLLQLFIFLTGNYGFFNLLTIALCVLLLDDATLLRCVPDAWRPRFKFAASTGPACPAWPRALTVSVGCLFLAISLIQFPPLFHLHLPWPGPVRAVASWLTPFRSINTYGLFAVMTTSRPEIVLEGSQDGVTWLPYAFKYKPGDLHRRGLLSRTSPGWIGRCGLRLWAPIGTIHGL